MDVTAHPFQQAGARAAAALAGRPDAGDLTGDDLDTLVETIVGHAALACEATVKDGPGWAWRQTLAALYPNSPATHHTARRKPLAEFRESVRALFDEDDTGEFNERPCWCCGTPTTHRWGKSCWPLAAPSSQLNTQPAGGNPVCRQCRIAVWCLPYGAGNDGYAVTTVEAPGAAAAEQRLAAGYVAQALTVLTERASSWPRGGSFAGTLDVIRDWMPQHLTIRRFRNDNQEPFLEETRVSPRQLGWLAEVLNDDGLTWAVEQIAERARTHPLLLALDGDKLENTAYDLQQPLLASRTEETKLLARLARQAADAYNRRYAPADPGTRGRVSATPPPSARTNQWSTDLLALLHADPDVSLTQAYQQCHLSPSTVAAWRERDPEFAQALDIAIGDSGRRQVQTIAWHGPYLEAIKDGHLAAGAAIQAGVSTSTVDKHRHRFPDFAAAEADAYAKLGLTPHEIVIKWLRQGHFLKDAAAAAGIPVGTLKAHRRRDAAFDQALIAAAAKGGRTLNPVGHLECPGPYCGSATGYEYGCREQACRVPKTAEVARWRESKATGEAADA